MTDGKNHVELSGFLRDDAELTDKRDGTPVVNIKLFVPHKQYFDMIVLRFYGDIADEATEKSLMAGDEIEVTGWLKQERWRSKDRGIPANRWVVMVETLNLLSRDNDLDFRSVDEL